MVGYFLVGFESFWCICSGMLSAWGWNYFRPKVQACHPCLLCNTSCSPDELPCGYEMTIHLSFSLFLSVPSASMTRLARSRTASLTSAGSVDGSRNRACTHSDSSEGVGQVSHTMEVSCWTLVHRLTCTHLERRGMEGGREKNEGLILLSFFLSQPFSMSFLSVFSVLALIKEYFTQKWKNFHHLITQLSLETRMTLFPL